MNQVKKIYMILTNGFDPDVRVYKEARYLVEKGFNVEILCWDRKCDYINSQNDNLEGIQITRFCIPSRPGSGLKQIFSFFKYAKCIKRFLKSQKEKYYLHCHDFDGILVGMYARNSKNIDLIFDMHEIYLNYTYAKLKIIFNLFFNKALKKSDWIIYVNDLQVKNLNINKEKLVYIPNYPEKNIYLPIHKNNTQKVRINYIGSLRDYTSLATLAEVGLQDNNIEVGFYGMGICYQKIKDKYKETTINVYGKYNGIEDSGEIYRNTDILYCSYDPNVINWNNAFPVKLFEAIITETPIIVTKNTVVGKFVTDNGIGLEIEYGNLKSVSKAIYEIKQNYNNYVEKLKIIASKYDWQSVSKNLDKIYLKGAPVRCLIYSWWKSNMVISSKEPLVSLGAEVVR